MKISRGFEMAAGFALALLSMRAGAYVLPPTVATNQKDSPVVTAGATVDAGPVAALRREQIRSAEERLNHGRTVYKTAVRAHGQDSWQARSILEWIGRMQTELKTVRGLSTAPVAGGAGKSGGESVTGGGRLHPR